MSSLNIKIEKFTGSNSFSLWQIKMRSLLKQQGLWAPLTKKPPTGEDAESLEEKAHATILLCLSDDVLAEVASEETAAGLWLKLESLYMTKSLTNKLFLKQRLFSLRMREGSSLRDHLDKLNAILLEMRNIDCKIEDEDAAMMLLVSLPNSFENFVQSFIGGKDTITLEEVRSALHSRELRHKASGNSSSDNQDEGLTVSGDRGLGNTGNRRSGRKQTKSTRPDDTCHYCKEKGHWRSQCPKRNVVQNNSGGQQSSAAVAQNAYNSEDDLALTVQDHTPLGEGWVLDSGASHHVCPHREWFSTYEQVTDTVLTANGEACKVEGIGSVRIRTQSGRVATLNQVRHVPHMTKNLLSLGVLTSKGFSFKGHGEELCVYRGSEEVLRGTKMGSLYVLQGSALTGSGKGLLAKPLSE